VRLVSNYFPFVSIFGSDFYEYHDDGDNLQSECPYFNTWPLKVEILRNKAELIID